MFCETCKSEEDTFKIVQKYQIPFKCPDCGSIDFPIRAMNGIVFVWSKQQPKKIGKIIIPDRLNQPFTSHFSVVLSAGKGCKDIKTGKFVPSQLKVGDRVWRDKDTPWRMPVDAPDGHTYDIAYLNILDIWGKEEYLEEEAIADVLY